MWNVIWTMPLLLLRLKSKKWITNDDEEYHLNCDDDHQRDQFTNESHTLKMDKKPNFFRIAVVEKGASEGTVQRWPLVKESNVYYTQTQLEKSHNAPFYPVTFHSQTASSRHWFVCSALLKPRFLSGSP